MFYGSLETIRVISLSNSSPDKNAAFPLQNKWTFVSKKHFRPIFLAPSEMFFRPIHSFEPIPLRNEGFSTSRTPSESRFRHAIPYQSGRKFDTQIFTNIIFHFSYNRKTKIFVLLFSALVTNASNNFCGNAARKFEKPFECSERA